MNNLMIVVLAVVLICYCGGKYCPKVLSSNKEVVLGVLVGMALCSFAGLKLEGFGSVENCITTCGTDSGDACQIFFDSVDSDCMRLRERARDRAERMAQSAAMLQSTTPPPSSPQLAELPPPPLRGGK